MIQRWPFATAAAFWLIVEADLLGSREGDEPRRGVLDEEIADLAARPGQVVQRAVGHARLLEELEDPPADERRVGRGLEDDAVARDEGRGRHAREDRVGEVPRRDHGARAERDVERLGELARIRRDGDLAPPAQHLARVELEEVDRLGRLDVGLGPGLPDLEHHRGGEVVLSRAHACGRPEEDGRAFARGEGGPRLLRLDGGVDRLERDLPVGEMVAGEHLRTVGGVQVFEETAGLDPPSAHDDGDLGALLAVHSGEGRLERGALLGAAEVGEGFVAKVFEHGREILSLHSAWRARMTVEELKQELDSGAPLCVLDVRETRELAVARFPFDVLHVPMGQVPARLDEIPADRRIVCACRSGARSAQVASFLKANGRDAVNLEGGILAWATRLDPSIPRY